MLKDVIWSEDGTYTPQGENTPYEFFTHALENSVQFDIQLGFFNSAAINVLSTSFATFIVNGGKMRMAINQIVSKEDKETIATGISGGLDSLFDLSNWESVKNALDEYGEHFFRCLAYLIQENRIEIQIIRPKHSSGIAHTKRGQFVDNEGMVVAFSGSANFTLGGLFNNLEDINIFLGTTPDITIKKKIENQKNTFDDIMHQRHSGVEYLSSSDLVAAIKSTYGEQDIDELINVEQKLKKIKKKLKNSHTDNIITQILPRFPYSTGPRDYQQLAFENWKNNGQKGLFAMATGTGKTITSLNCLLEIYKRKGYYKALILVPTVTLVNQWEQECLKFNFSNIIKVYSKNLLWKDEIDRIYFNEKYKTEKDTEVSYVIISTYASYSKEVVFDILNKFDSRRLLMIADECHNMGSGSIAKRLKAIPYLRRIGLSATPERQYDDNGNNKLRKFFGVDGNYTFEYSMEEAIKKEVLCEYMYYPHLVRLTSDEMDAYMELSEKISKFYNYNTESFDKEDDVLKMLLLRRKRIIHKAHNKLEVFKDIIKNRFKEKGNLKYSLVYVPEGNKPEYLPGNDDFDGSEEIEDDNITMHLIEEYTEAITQVDEKVTVRMFTSGQKDREEILSDFASGKLHVLTSMKCLDEGVDVPRSELAIFCSSTGNPRQFIQRRGRVLRTHPDKKFAELHDLVVIPEVNVNSNSYRMEKSLLKNELIRVNNFALLSLNPSYSEMELREIMNHYGLNLYNNHIL